ncbi:hypothetical protein NCU05906 [Neurospora crassa OR74A]|uniref:BTB domain-containing protein n=1 Tax=Neurospora crassa (strain ATCC 24698 / 74-OR23-1A / CBS 708.71 / DSM 1257 / FGSC 987) TaxID=367110 RepID=Q7S0N4_NEUCR|nr:hypothetical protein NCU05906 [Neurospora crassa OR74A]EAA28870.3 hypothetical protein NCU05906 [Neurospora crassa OR74A]|eukprot:XP_958106.3 hypothetical protein NCU05906 [Neurospora crassa OR74A]
MGDDSDILEVSPVGDIILVVGPPEEEQVRLRVSSTILRSASKVFDAMFSPPWVESSRTLSLEAPKDVELPEDDSEAMKAICYAIHHRPDMIPFVDVNGKQILQAARTIDKYDLGTATQLLTDKWLRPQLQGKSVEDLLYMAAAATVVENYEAFSKLTWLVMITHEGSYRRFQNDEQLSELLPRVTFVLLAERTFLIREQIFKALHGAGPEQTCQCVQTVKNEIESVRDGFGAGNTISILKALRGMVKVANAQDALEEISCSANRRHWCRELRFPDWTESETSLCLRCLQNDPNMEKACEHKKELSYNDRYREKRELNTLYLY